MIIKTIRVEFTRKKPSLISIIAVKINVLQVLIVIIKSFVLKGMHLLYTNNL
jgi:hypothetical protein